MFIINYRVFKLGDIMFECECGHYIGLDDLDYTDVNFDIVCDECKRKYNIRVKEIKEKKIILKEFKRDENNELISENRNDGIYMLFEDGTSIKWVTKTGQISKVWREYIKQIYLDKHKKLPPYKAVAYDENK